MWAHDPRSAQDMSTSRNLCSPGWYIDFLFQAEHRRQEPHNRHAEQQLQQAADLRQVYETILQVVELNKDESGKLHSIALSDGEYVSHNVETPTRVMFEGLKRFDLVHINSAPVTKDMIGLDTIDHLEVANKKGEVSR